MKKRLFSSVLLVVVAVLLTFPLDTDAACNKYGKITYSVNLTNGSYVYITPVPTATTATPGYNYYFWIPASYGNVLGSAHSAQASGKTILIYGNATSCPDSGINRYGGTANQINIVNFY